MKRNLVESTYGRFCIKFPQSRMKDERHPSHQFLVCLKGSCQHLLSSCVNFSIFKNNVAGILIGVYFTKLEWLALVRNSTMCSNWLKFQKNHLEIHLADLIILQECSLDGLVHVSSFYCNRGEKQEGHHLSFQQRTNSKEM